MSQAASLMRAVLGGVAEGEALAALEVALALEVDPIEWCAHTGGVGMDEALRRAALWAGLPFAQAVPARVEGQPQIHRLDSLAQVRTLRATLDGEDVIFAAPRFAGFISLEAHAASHPEFGRSFCVVPPAAIRDWLARASTAQMLDESRQRLSRRWPYASGHIDLTLSARLLFIAAIVAVVLAAALAAAIAKPVLVPLVAIILLGPAILRLIAVAWPQQSLSPETMLPDAALPVYSVLVPLRDEAHMVPQLAEALGALDYPGEKLDILFVIEEKSADTVAAVRRFLADPRFSLVEVPEAAPATKPKALDFALPLVRGEHVVIYDAEDIPDPDQLRLAASVFAAEPGIDCLQAELVVDNAAETPLTALFAGEYAGQFGLMLPLLARLRLPMPLGGTSNHFRAAALREVGGWDAFNVTEDADLGVRLSRLRYRTATLLSETGEEAPISLHSWMMQRTRWLKGFMQTFIVHNRSPRRFLKDIGWRGFLFFQLYVGSLILSAPLHTVFLATFLLSALQPGTVWFADPWDWVSAGILIVGYGGAAALVVAGLARRKRLDLLPAQTLLPLYWVLHSIAAARAIGELLVRPYFWAKTEHGRTRVARTGVGALVQAE